MRAFFVQRTFGKANNYLEAPLVAKTSSLKVKKRNLSGPFDIIQRQPCVPQHPSWEPLKLASNQQR